MSNIPRARWHLIDAITDHADDAGYLCTSIKLALADMTRIKPAFRAAPELPPLTKSQRDAAVWMRAQGISLNRISVVLKTNIGRVSEAINGKKKRAA